MDIFIFFVGFKFKLINFLLFKDLIIFEINFFGTFLSITNRHLLKIIEFLLNVNLDC